MASPPQLHNEHTTLVAPAEPTTLPLDTEVLTDLDLMMLEIYTPLLLLLDRPPLLAASSFAQIVDGLKESLSRALVPFYPLAGRLVRRKEDGGMPMLLCNDAGAVFTSAEVDAAMRDVCNVDGDFQALAWLAGMEQAGIDPAKLFQEAPPESGRPCLVVQVTGFRCGRLAISANWLHTAADGHSGFQFMQAWAELSRATTSGSADAAGALAALSLDHAAAAPAPNHGRAKLLRAANLYADPDAGSDASSVLWRRSADPTPMPLTLSTKLKHVVYTHDAIQRLKQHVSASDPDSTAPPFSTVDCIGAHLWQSVCRARIPACAPPASSNGTAGNALHHQPVQYLTFVDARRRRKLPTTDAATDATSSSCLLPSDYCGNSLLVTATPPDSTTPAEVAAQPLAATARAVRGSVAATGAHSFRHLLGLARAHGRGQVALGLPRPGRDFGTSSWTGFDLYGRLRFWDTPPVLAVRNAPPNPLLDGFAWLLPSATGPRDVAVLLYVAEDAMPRLLSDPLFCAFVTL